MGYEFIFDKRLGISVPSLDDDWDVLDEKTKESILLKWELTRGRIPDRISELESEINHKQSCLNKEENFIRSCELNAEISELASVINDLWIWYRTNQELVPTVAHF